MPDRQTIDLSISLQAYDFSEQIEISGHATAIFVTRQIGTYQIHHCTITIRST